MWAWVNSRGRPITQASSWVHRFHLRAPGAKPQMPEGGGCCLPRFLTLALCPDPRRFRPIQKDFSLAKETQSRIELTCPRQVR